MSMYPDIRPEPSAPNPPGFIDIEQKVPINQPPYPPPPYSGPNYGPGQSYPMPVHTTVVVTQPTPASETTPTIPIDKFPPDSINMKCYFCHENIKTRIEGQTTICTWLLCALLFIIGCSCGCCLIPFCTKGTRDILHYCPKCKQFLGSYQRFR